MKVLTISIGFTVMLFQCSGLNGASVAEPKLKVVFEPTPQPTPKLPILPTPPTPAVSTIPDHIAELSTSELCDRIGQIEVVPTRDPTITDPIYESILAKGKEAVPCLIEKIGNGTLIKDPRYSVPTWHSYAVGDTALFILLKIVSKNDADWTTKMLAALPPSSQKEYKTNGIYAYFNYVLDQKNRNKIQQWWKKQLKELKK